ncbi:hypothetical protein GCM10017581_063350 [Dactylosporangium matsuzakiense]|uniref:DUF8167 domain-containing protein n=2 Tax=Dactylosporangium matsuzakiense TaxID=53360 RepID=A0A9W6NPR1_9ACTN|nr:hypothetical protein GCM10017581_063350 [Dactylosporangium matsuzakiense]
MPAKLLRGAGRVLLGLGAAGAVLSALAMLGALIFARDRLGLPATTFVWSGTVICGAAAAHSLGRRLGDEQ